MNDITIELTKHELRVLEYLLDDHRKNLERDIERKQYPVVVMLAEEDHAELMEIGKRLFRWENMDAFIEFCNTSRYPN